MTEEQIVERVAREAFDVDRPDEWQMRRARAVLALLGPAPLEWEPYLVRDNEARSGDYTLSTINTGTRVWWNYSTHIDTCATPEAAKAAAEAHHRAQWFAGTVLGQEGGA